MGTAAAVEALPDDAEPMAADGVATPKAEKPRFGTPLASVFAPAAPFCVFDVPLADEEDAPDRSAAGALARSGLPGADASVWAEASGAVSVAWPCVRACWTTLPVVVCILAVVAAKAAVPL